MKTVTIELSGCIFVEVDANTDEEAATMAMDKLYALARHANHEVVNVGALEVHDAEVVNVEDE